MFKYEMKNIIATPKVALLELAQPDMIKSPKGR
jgi:hypothetical protein